LKKQKKEYNIQVMVQTAKVTLILFSLILIIPLQASASSISDYPVVSHWTCDETSGVRYDSNTTNSNDLTDNNTVGSVTGKRNNACDLEKDNNEYLSITDANQTGLDDSTLAISFWIKLETQPSPQDTGQIIINKMHNQPARYGYNLAYGQYPTNSWFISNTTGNNDIRGNYPVQTLTNGTWYHIVWSHSSTLSDTYVNGTLIQSATAYTIGNSTADFKIGYKTYWNELATEQYFDGAIDEITFFSTSLTQTDVTTLYNSGTPLEYESAVVSNLVPVVISDTIDPMLTSVTCSATSTSTICGYLYASTTNPVTPTNLLAYVLMFAISFVGAFMIFRKLS